MIYLPKFVVILFKILFFFHNFISFLIVLIILFYKHKTKLILKLNIYISLTQSTTGGSQNTIVAPIELKIDHEIIESEELIIEHQKLRAFIPKSLINEDKKTRQIIPLIKITTDPSIVIEPPLNTNTAKKITPTLSDNDLSSTEQVWNAIKQIIMNQIYAKTKKPPFKIILLTQIEGYYDWLEKERNEPTDNSIIKKNLNTIELVNWFLRELSDIEPKLEAFDTINGLSPNLVKKLKAVLFQVNKNSKGMEALVESFKVYDNLLENIQDVLKNLRTEFHKVAKVSQDNTTPVLNDDILIKPKENDNNNEKIITEKNEELNLTNEIVSDEGAIKKSENRFDDEL